MSDHLRLGKDGETVAAAYLTSCGYRILARNYRCRLGEIDIVAEHSGIISFIEVKTRGHAAALPEEAVGPAKRRRLTRVASSFIKRFRLHHLPCRFDVLALTPTATGTHRITHFADAFEALE